MTQTQTLTSEVFVPIWFSGAVGACPEEHFIDHVTFSQTMSKEPGDFSCRIQLGGIFTIMLTGKGIDMTYMLMIQRCLFLPKSEKNTKKNWSL